MSIKTSVSIDGENRAFDSSAETLRTNVFAILCVRGVDKGIRNRLEVALQSRESRFHFQEGNVLVEANEVSADMNGSASPDA